MYLLVLLVSFCNCLVSHVSVSSLVATDSKGSSRATDVKKKKQY